MSTAKLYTTGSRRIYESFVGDVIRPQSPARKRARENCSTNAPARGWCWRTRDPACTSFTASAQRMSPLKLRRPGNKDGMIDVTTDNVEEASTNPAGHSAPAATAAVEVSTGECKGEEASAEEAVTPRSVLGPHGHVVTVGQDGKMEKCYKCKAEGELLLCDGDDCPLAVHTRCISLNQIPEGEWFCRFCSTSYVTVEKRFTNEDGAPRYSVLWKCSDLDVR